MLGISLIERAVARALAASQIQRVVVSTDSDEIARLAVGAGAQVPFMRPDDLAGSGIGKFQVWQHALAACEVYYGEVYDTFVDVDCTNPLCDSADIDAMIARFQRDRLEGVDALFTVCQARKNPYFNLVEPDASGAMRMSKGSQVSVLARQVAPEVFEHIAGVYVMDTDYLRRCNHLLDGHAEGYKLSEWKGIDIDTESDWAIAEMFLRKASAGLPQDGLSEETGSRGNAG